MHGVSLPSPRPSAPPRAARPSVHPLPVRPGTLPRAGRKPAVIGNNRSHSGVLTMVQLSYPGVYVVEKSSGVNTITGVATSIAAFFGRTQKGPINRAIRCLGYPDFLRSFGGAHPESEIGAAVKLFFDNGGTDCYVVRLAGAGSQAAGVDLRNWANAHVLTATAKMAGVWGNGLRLEISYATPTPGETFNLTVSQVEGGREVAREVHANLSMDPTSARFAPSFVTQASALIDLATGGGLQPRRSGPRRVLRGTPAAGHQPGATARQPGRADRFRQPHRRPAVRDFGQRVGLRAGEPGHLERQRCRHRHHRRPGNPAARPASTTRLARWFRRRRCRCRWRPRPMSAASASCGSPRPAATPPVSTSAAPPPRTSPPG
jgi:hypothetical protein